MPGCDAADATRAQHGDGRDGVDHFGQSGDIPDLYRVHRLDVDAILEAAATACIERRRGSIGRAAPRGR